MDYQRRQRRIGVLTVILCLLIVVLWRMISPHTSRYQDAENEGRVKERLERIQPPPGAKQVKLNTSIRQGWPEAAADYLIDSDCAKLKEYYKIEFERQGFVFGEEYRSLQSAPEPDSLFYSDHDYSVGLSCNSAEEQPRSYMIVLTLDTRVNKQAPLPNPMPGVPR